MARKRNEARSLSTEGAAASPVTHRRSARPKTAQAQPEAVENAATSVDAVVSPETSQTVDSGARASLDPISERDEIAKLAYSYFEARGGQGGSSEEDWLRAEAEFRRRREASAS